VRSRWWLRSPSPASGCARSGKEPLDDPAPWVNSEANLTGVLTHDLDRDQGGHGDLFAGIPTVGEDPLDKWEGAARSLQKRPAAVAILDTGWMGLDNEATAIGVDQRVALAPVVRLARIVTARTAGFGGLDALAVNDRGRPAGVAPPPVRDLPSRARGSSVQSARRRTRRQTSGKSFPWRQVVRQQAPRAARPHDIEDAV
jgi:hypothetical protein